VTDDDIHISWCEQERERLEDAVSNLQGDIYTLRADIKERNLEIEGLKNVRNSAVVDAHMYREELKRVHAEVKVLRNEITGLNNKITGMSMANQSLRDANSKLNKRNQELVTEIGRTNKYVTERDELREQVTFLEGQHEAAIREMATLQTTYDKRVEEFYVSYSRQIKELDSKLNRRDELQERLMRWETNLTRESSKARKEGNYMVAGSLTAIRMCVTAIISGEEFGGS
jgi:chromosome segregation ATPase